MRSRLGSSSSGPTDACAFRAEDVEDRLRPATVVEVEASGWQNEEESG